MPTPPSQPPPPQSPPIPPPISASIIGCNDDLLTEILTHLPIKPVTRFKSVNKQFKSLITQPQFSLLHSLRHPHPPPTAVFFRHHITNHPSFSLLSLTTPPSPSPPFRFSPPLTLLQSTNGLLLLSLPSHLLVSNPTTHLTARIPLPDLPSAVGYSLAFDPSLWAHAYSLLIVHASPINGDNIHTAFAVTIYSSRTRRWVATVDRFDAPFDRGVYWGGRVLWLSHTGNMVYYDFESEGVRSLVLPKVYDEAVYMDRFRYFGESCGRLHLVEIRTNCVREFDVLELEERAEGVLAWIVKYRVDLDVVGCGFEGDMFQDHVDRFGRELRFYAFSILALVGGQQGEGGGEGEGDALVLSVPGKVISYDFKRKVSRLLDNVVDDCDKWLPFRGYNAFPLIESLACV